MIVLLLVWIGMFVYFRLPALQDVANQQDLDDATKRQKQSAQTPIFIFVEMEK